MRIAVVSLLTLAVFASTAWAGEEEVEWSYEGETGPRFWGSLSPAFADCSKGTRQSPIDIRSPFGRSDAGVHLRLVPSAVGLENNGHAINVTSDRTQQLFLVGRRYTLLQFHWHVPSENTIAGRRYPLELHFVFTRPDGGAAVVGVLVREGRANHAFGQLVAAFPKRKGQKTEVSRPVAIASLLPPTRVAYQFAGSLTTPPCSEGIRWNVLTRTIEVSSAQIEAFEAIIEFNSRPVQPRNHRTIRVG